MAAEKNTQAQSTDGGTPAKNEGAELTESKKKLAEQHAAKVAAKAAAAEAEKAKKAPFVVAPGKSITTVRGIVDAGQAVTALDFVRKSSDREVGEKRLAELVEKKLVVKQ